MGARAEPVDRVFAVVAGEVTTEAYVHVQDVVRGIKLGLEAPEDKIRSQVYNLGTSSGNYTKDQIVAIILKRLPETETTTTPTKGATR